MLRNTLFVLAIVCGAMFTPCQAQNFRVQAAVYNEPVSPSYFQDRGVQHVMENTDNNGFYRYFVGSYNTREEAEAVQTQLIQKGFPNATILDLEEQRALCGTPCPYSGKRLFVRDTAQSETVRNLYFDYNKSSLSLESKAELDKVFKHMKENPDTKLQILGHTDSKGSAEYNIALATRRARAARNYLIEKGIHQTRLHIKVFGEFNPEDSSMDMTNQQSPDAAKYNRRVTLAFVSPEGEVQNNDVLIGAPAGK